MSIPSSRVSIVGVCSLPSEFSLKDKLINLFWVQHKVLFDCKVICLGITVLLVMAAHCENLLKTDLDNILSALFSLSWSSIISKLTPIAI